MTFVRVLDFVKGLFTEVAGEQHPCADEIAESDKRISDNIDAAYRRITDPNCPKETLDAATVCLDSMTLDLRKMKGETR